MINWAVLTIKDAINAVLETLGLGVVAGVVVGILSTVITTYLDQPYL